VDEDTVQAVREELSGDFEEHAKWMTDDECRDVDAAINAYRVASNFYDAVTDLNWADLFTGVVLKYRFDQRQMQLADQNA